jgi:hypothetical protein
MAGSPRMVPTFIADRSTGAAPSFSPAASPRVRRRPSSWPPRRPRNTDAGVAHPIGAGVHCSSAHIRQVGADAALEGVQPLVRSRYTFPSRLPDPGRLAVPTRPVVVGSAPIHTLRFQGRTAPSFNDPLRRAAVGSLIPLGQSTPRGALRALSTPGQVAGAANRINPALEAHRPRRPARLRSPRKPLSQVTRPYGQDRTATLRARSSCPDLQKRHAARLSERGATTPSRRVALLRFVRSGRLRRRSGAAGGRPTRERGRLPTALLLFALRAAATGG